MLDFTDAGEIAEDCYGEPYGESITPLGEITSLSEHLTAIRNRLVETAAQAAVNSK